MMIFAKIKDGVCINTMVFGSKEKALEFDDTLIEVVEGYGIGDCYKDSQWSKPVPTTEEKIEEIKKQLVKLDSTVDRQWEDYYIRENITPVDRIAVVITKKEELRTELQELTKVGEEN